MTSLYNFETNDTVENERLDNERLDKVHRMNTLNTNYQNTENHKNKSYLSYGSDYNEKLLNEVVSKNNKVDYYSMCALINFIIITFNSVFSIIIYLYVSETANTLSILNTPNITDTIVKIEKLVEVACNDLGGVC